MDEKNWDEPMAKTRAAFEAHSGEIDGRITQEGRHKYVFDAQRENVDLQLEARSVFHNIWSVLPVRSLRPVLVAKSKIFLLSISGPLLFSSLYGHNDPVLAVEAVPFHPPPLRWHPTEWMVYPGRTASPSDCLNELSQVFLCGHWITLSLLLIPA